MELSKLIDSQKLLDITGTLLVLYDTALVLNSKESKENQESERFKLIEEKIKKLEKDDRIPILLQNSGLSGFNLGYLRDFLKEIKEAYTDGKRCNWDFCTKQIKDTHDVILKKYIELSKISFYDSFL